MIRADSLRLHRRSWRILNQTTSHVLCCLQRLSLTAEALFPGRSSMHSPAVKMVPPDRKQAQKLTFASLNHFGPTAQYTRRPALTGRRSFFVRARYDRE